ncbi:MAG TPA: phosphotransferase [Ktedonobacterales bacterium]
MADFFARNLMTAGADRSAEEGDAELGTLLLRYLRHHFHPRVGAWVLAGRDDHETLRRTCNAAEVLHRLDLDGDTATMVRASGDWLINLPARDHLSVAQRNDMRLYPSRFKALAYLGRFFDGIHVRHDFLDLLEREQNDLDIVRQAGESSILGTCIVLDALLQLDRNGRREELCSAREYSRIRNKIVRKLHGQLRAWVGARTRNNGKSGGARRPEIENWRDLSYVLGLLLETDAGNLLEADVTCAKGFLIEAVSEPDRLRSAKATYTLYAALQLADHFPADSNVHTAIESLLGELRSAYSTIDAAASDRGNVRRWDLIIHTLVLRLLLSQYRNAARDGVAAFARAMVSHFLRDVERHQAAEGDSQDTELAAAVRNHLHVEIIGNKELTGGFSNDQVYRVTFRSWFPALEAGGQPHQAGHQANASLIIKRSTRDAFEQTAENYRRLPANVLDAFVRQPSAAYVNDSGTAPTYYLVMEDLTHLYTLRHLFNEFDHPIMSNTRKDLLRRATLLTCEVVFKLFRQPGGGIPAAVTSQLAQLYLAPMERKLTRAAGRMSWLKSLLKGYPAGRYRYRSLDYYLALVSQHADILQPRFLGITHGDFHARNIMLDDDCARIKLIDLDKLNRTGDYLADIGTVLQDLCAYRRVSEPEREFALPLEKVTLGTNLVASGSAAAAAMPYPPLGTPASVYLQSVLLDAVDRFAKGIGDRHWKPRLWLATATSLLSYVDFQSQREPAAVLYGEGIRLLDEVGQYLEHGRPLPDLLFLQEWPERVAAPGNVPSDLPEWCQRSALLKDVHERMLQLGLHPAYSSSAVRYFADAENGEPVAVLAAHHGALARLKLRGGEIASLPQSRVRFKLVNQKNERLRLAAEISEDASVTEIIAVVASALAPVITPKRAVATRRRGS